MWPGPGLGLGLGLRLGLRLRLRLGAGAARLRAALVRDRLEENAIVHPAVARLAVELAEGDHVEGAVQDAAHDARLGRRAHLLEPGVSVVEQHGAHAAHTGLELRIALGLGLRLGLARRSTARRSITVGPPLFDVREMAAAPANAAPPSSGWPCSGSPGRSPHRPSRSQRRAPACRSGMLHACGCVHISTVRAVWVHRANAPRFTPHPTPKSVHRPQAALGVGRPSCTVGHRPSLAP